MVDRFELDELIQLTDTTGTGIIDESKVKAAIADASNIIDGYLGGRYNLPLANSPAVLVRLCANMARYNLYDNAVSEVVERNNKAALDFLHNVGTGKIKLGLTSDSQELESDQVIQIDSDETVFNRDRSKGFI